MASDLSATQPTAGTLIHRAALPNGYFVARLNSPSFAHAVHPGHRVIVTGQGDDAPAPAIAIMRCNATAGWIELLYREEQGAASPLAQTPLNAAVQLSGPVGEPIVVPADTARLILLGRSTHLAPLVFLIDVLRASRQCTLLALLQLDSGEPPFQPRPSRIVLPGMPPGVIAAVPLLEDWGIPSRLADPADRPGCFEGDVVTLARCWLESQPEPARAQWQIVDTRSA